LKHNVELITIVALWILFYSIFIGISIAFGQLEEVNQTLVNQIQSQLDNNTRQFEQMCLGSNSSDTDDQVCSDLMFEGNEIMRNLTDAEMGIIGNEGN
jgi:predicted PurR-regulated permease PerM